MNNLEEIEKELRKFGFSEKITERIFALVDADNYEGHSKARQALVDKGKEILPIMHRLSKSEHIAIRKEAAKIVELIGHDSSIPIALDMLEDRESEIRWIAAEALIRIGRNSIRPLLEALVLNGSSYYLRQGAHHVLSELVNDKDTKELRQLVHVLKTEAEIPERIPLDASNALRNTSS